MGDIQIQIEAEKRSGMRVGMPPSWIVVTHMPTKTVIKDKIKGEE